MRVPAWTQPMSDSEDEWTPATAAAENDTSVKYSDDEGEEHGTADLDLSGGEGYHTANERTLIPHFCESRCARVSHATLWSCIRLRIRIIIIIKPTYSSMALIAPLPV